MRRIGMVGLAVAVLMAIAVPSVLAMEGGKPLVQEQFDTRFVEEPDLLVLAVCGVEVRTEFHFWGNFTLYSDLSARTHQNSEIISTDPVTGEVLLIERNAFSFGDVRISPRQVCAKTRYPLRSAVISSSAAYASASGDTIGCGGVCGGMIERRENISRSG